MFSSLDDVKLHCANLKQKFGAKLVNARTAALIFFAAALKASHIFYFDKYIVLVF